MKAPLRLLLSLGLVGLSSGSAYAQGPAHAPPGNSAIQQYSEDVPDAGGARPTSSIGHSSGGQPSVLSRRQTAALLARGGPGHDLARFAQATSPTRASKQAVGGGGAKPHSQTFSNAPTFHAEGSSPLAEALDRAVIGGDSGGRGMGAALPVLMLMAAAAGIAYALGRRGRQRA